MAERRHPVHDFIDTTPWPDVINEAIEEIKSVYSKDVAKGDRLGRSVATVALMEGLGFSSYLMQVAQRVSNPQARLLFTVTAGSMAGAYGNPAFAFLNAEQLYRIGKPLEIPVEVKSVFEFFINNVSRSVGINPEGYEGKRSANEIDWMMTEQALARMIPTITTLEFIDKYTEMALNRLEDDDFNAPPREGFRRGRDRFHVLYEAALLALNRS